MDQQQQRKRPFKEFDNKWLGALVTPAQSYVCIELLKPQSCSVKEELCFNILRVSAVWTKLHTQIFVKKYISTFQCYPNFMTQKLRAWQKMALWLLLLFALPSAVPTRGGNLASFQRVKQDFCSSYILV